MLSIFQSTFPRGERPLIYGRTVCSIDFNPRSRVGNDLFLSPMPIFDKISIHVPAWGTTVSETSNPVSFCISIHVPAWGTTHNCTMYLYTDIFQSTFPRGERQSKRSSGKIPNLFQSTFPRGERQKSIQHCIRQMDFNPRSRVGNDACPHHHCCDSVHFNPRSRVGNDSKFQQFFTYIFV